MASSVITRSISGELVCLIKMSSKNPTEKGEQEAMIKKTGSAWAQLSAIVYAFSTSLLELV
jgi:hypothetical protein